MGLPWAFILLVTLIGFASTDLAKDRQECASQLTGLATCLPYVAGNAKNPTMDCCSGLKQVLQKSKKCLCLLVKDKDDPDLGLKINATLALGLPTTCNTPANVSDCPDLLHLSPGSPAAKVFEDYVNSTKGSNTTQISKGKGNTDGSTSSSQLKNDGGKGERFLAMEIVGGILIWCFSWPHLIFNL